MRDRALPIPEENRPIAYFWQAYVRPRRGRLFLGFLSATFAGVAALLLPQVLRGVVDDLHQNPTVDTLVSGIILMLVFSILEGAMYLARRQFTVKPAVEIERSLREDLYARLQRLPSSFHDAWSSGQLLSRSMADLGLIRRYLAFGGVMTLSSAVMIIVGLVMLYRLDWRFLVLYSLIIAPMTLGAFAFRTRYRNASRTVMDLQGDLATTIEESVQGIRVLKAFGRADFSAGQLVEQLGRLRSAELYKASTLGWFIGLVTALPALTTAAALVIGLLLIADGQMTAGTLVAYFATARVLTMPLQDLGQLIGMFISMKSALQRHIEIMGAERTISSPEHPVTLGGRTQGTGTTPASGSLSFAAAEFRYPDAPADSEPLLRDITLEIRPGETMALVGETGSGKTSLLNLVPRLYDPTSGSVTIDGADLRDLSLEDLRRRVAVAFEDATLFSASVAENVLLGVDESDPARREEILRQALDVAQAGFVDRLPDGAETQIGEEGLSLSGGQRQRLALARAIAADPEIMILDDPLSALDVTTEAKVIEGLDRVLADTTTLLVAHRPSTVALADRVALLHEGRIAAVGTHAELLASNDQYRHVIASLEAQETLEADADSDTAASTPERTVRP